MMILCIFGLAARNTILCEAKGGLDWTGAGELGGGVHGFVIAWMIIVGLKDLVVFGDPGGGVGGGVLIIWTPGDRAPAIRATICCGDAGDTCNGDANGECIGDTLSGDPSGWRNIGA